MTSRGMPPAYTRDKILDPKLAEAARAFTAWAVDQKVGAKPVFGRVETLPPAPTLLPYGIGTYEKQRAAAGNPDHRARVARPVPRRPRGAGGDAYRGLSHLLESTAVDPPSARLSRSRRRRAWSWPGLMSWSPGGHSCMEKTNEPEGFRAIVSAAWADVLALHRCSP